MQASHVLLGRPWQHSHESSHDGRHITYTVMSIGHKYVLKQMSPSQVIEMHRKIDELRDKKRKKEGHVEAEAQGEGQRRKLKGKAKLLLVEHKEMREEVGVESELILKDHELQDPREALSMDTLMGCPNIPKRVSVKGKEDLSCGHQGTIGKLNTFSITNEQSVNVSLSLNEPIDSLPCIDNVLVENVDTLVDPIDDRIDSSSKIDLCPPSVDTRSLNASSLSCNDCVDQSVCEGSSLVEGPCNMIKEPQVSGTNDNVDQLNRSDSMSISIVEDLIACFVVDHSLFKYNILFEDDEITHSDVPSGVKLESSVVLNNYIVYSNPLWCEAFPPKDGNLFLENEILDSMTNAFEPIGNHTHENTLEEVDLQDTFLYYLFTYDDAHAVEWSMMLENESANQTKGEVLGPSPWISFPFDPGSELNCGTCVVMLGQDDKYHLDGFVDTFPYDEKSFLRVYNPIKEHTLCSFLRPFLYSFFQYDLLDRTFYRGSLKLVVILHMRTP
ncbi:hypothetical protein KY284_012700 [Solanum tuberosum]|nr:hypothetical protein KY284_012700 [Solanum tuberosum]